MMLEVDNLHFSIDGKPILQRISEQFEPYKIHGIVGPNGSGKSTLLKNLCRVWKPQQGTVFINNTDYKIFARKELSKIITLVPQNTRISFPISVYDIVTMGRHPHLGRFQSLKKRDRDVVKQALLATQTYELKERHINELSGGECQLAIIARALATEASLILLDEPTSELDIKHKLTIMELLVSLKQQGKTILVSIHDLDIARRYCDTISILHHGTLYYRGSPSKAFSQENIKTVFDVNVVEITDDSISALYFYNAHDNNL